MKDEYTIINKAAIQKEKEELKGIINKHLGYAEEEIYDKIDSLCSQSTPLIPEIEKAFDAGEKRGYEIPSFQMRGMSVNTENPNVKDYISNLKLDI